MRLWRLGLQKLGTPGALMLASRYDNLGPQLRRNADEFIHHGPKLMSRVLLALRPDRVAMAAVDSARRGDDAIVLSRPGDFGGDLFENVNVAIQDAIDDVHRRQRVAYG